MILGALFAVSYVVGAITEYRKTPEQKAADQEHRRAADFARAEAERESALKYAVETEAPALCRVAVEKQLKAPSSAEFQSEQASV